MNELGELRPSQLIFTFGVGALVDLPRISGLIMGLDDWHTTDCIEVTEERLLAALQKRMGAQLSRLMLPPVGLDDMKRDPAAPARGVPIAPFPRWLRCPICDTLATIESGVFKLAQDQWRPEQTRYVHATCTKMSSPAALPVRFLLACREGHLTDFPWVEYVHNGNTSCSPARLTLREYGVAGDASDIIVKCLECGVERRMGDAFDRDRFKSKCPGHHPHLRMVESKPCEEEARTILLGASNSWFPVILSALSIPSAVDKLAQLVGEYWSQLKDLPSLDVAKYVTAPSRMPAFAEYSPEAVWTAIEAKKQGAGSATKDDENLKVPEWEVLCGKAAHGQHPDFSIRHVAPPLGLEKYFEPICLVDRVREVRALMAFTRIESKGDFVDAEYKDDGRYTRLCRKPPEWLPVSEVRGEGIFLRFREDALQAWEALPEVKALESEFLEGHRKWRKLRKIEPAGENFPGMRYVLLHSFSHAMMRQISLECGYTAASIRERLYCLPAGAAHGPMAGILIYTSASDSDGTLGGLVALGESQPLGRHIQQALEAMRICGSDPLCSEHRVSADGRGIHGACCHACLFASETSCESGNRYLDRTVLAPTFAARKAEFFKGI